MGISSWMAVGWLWKKNGKYMGFCDNCKKDVELNHCDGPDDGSFECKECGMVVLDD